MAASRMFLRFSDDALSSLGPNEEGLIRAHFTGSQNANDTIQKAYEATVKQRQICESKKWRVKFRGRDLVLRDEADKVLRWVDRFKSVGDIVASADPIHIGLPWAGIRMILEAIVADSRQMAALLTGMNLAIHIVNRLKAYFGYFAHLQTTTTTLTLEKALAKMYAVVLQFFDTATTYQKGSATRIWKGMWKESDLDKFTSESKDWAIQVEIDASNCERELSQQDRDDTKRWRDSTLAQRLDDITNGVANVQTTQQTTQQATERQISDILTSQQAAKHRMIIDWLAPPDPYSNHNTACRKREPDTGNWLLQSNEYKGWKTSHNSLLRLTGQAGCGKTVLCSTVIEDVRVHCQQSGTAFAFYYFTFSDQQKQSYQNFLVSLASQFSKIGSFFTVLQSLYDTIYPSKPSIDELETTLSAYLRQLQQQQPQGQVVIIADALDELPEDDAEESRSTLLDWLKRMVQSDYPLNVFLTSRPLQDIDDALNHETSGDRCLQLRPELANADIQKYLDTELEKHPRLNRLSGQLKDEIRQVFRDKADGMYVLTSDLRMLRLLTHQVPLGGLPARHVENLKSTRQVYIQGVLRGLPRGLDATYERMLLQIDDIFHDEALKALRWLAFAKKPLTLAEISEACIINHTEVPYVLIENRADSAVEILDILAGLVITEESGATTNGVSSLHGPGNDNSRANTSRIRVRLAHYSVKEYLESSRILDSKATKFVLRKQDQQILAQSCLAYVLYCCKASEPTTVRDRNAFPFLQYAADAWLELIFRDEATPPGHEVQLLQSDEYRAGWIQSMKDIYASRQLSEIGSALRCASHLGLLSTCRALLDQGASVDDEEGPHTSALQVASVAGHPGVVRLLLARGADVNLRSKENSVEGTVHGYNDALQAAVYHGHEEVVRVLLDAGADLDNRGGSYGSALQIAASKNHGKLVEVLLDAGADVNASRGECSPALQAAFNAGGVQAHSRLQMVKLLLERGASVNARGGEYGTALQAASLRGHDEAVKLLIDAGADVNVRGGEYGSALQAAADGRGGRQDCFRTVKLLLEAGADVNVPPAEHGTALQAASHRGYYEVVELLIDAGAEVNALGGEYGTALRAACDWGLHPSACVETVKLLLKAGADVNARGEEGTALQSVSSRGYEDVVKLLIDAGADVNAEGGEYGTALQAASYENNSRVVKMLRDAGATT